MRGGASQVGPARPPVEAEFQRVAGAHPIPFFPVFTAGVMTVQRSTRSARSSAGEYSSGDGGA
jgi:hypothetical protein